MDMMIKKKKTRKNRYFKVIARLLFFFLLVLPRKPIKWGKKNFPDIWKRLLIKNVSVFIFSLVMSCHCNTTSSHLCSETSFICNVCHFHAKENTRTCFRVSQIHTRLPIRAVIFHIITKPKKRQLRYRKKWKWCTRVKKAVITLALFVFICLFWFSKQIEFLLISN